MDVKIKLTVNGDAIEAQVDARTLLVSFLREHRGLTGTHQGCDTAQCGACTVLLDGRAIKSCTVLAAQVQGRQVTTIEGITPADGTLHPMQQAFKQCHGLQCGFCTPGMVMSAIDLVTHHSVADEPALRAALNGNICRCTGYQNIVASIQQGAAAMLNSKS
jgi:carbon-monoxide dehydrogenase small subunit